MPPVGIRVLETKCYAILDYMAELSELCKLPKMGPRSGALAHKEIISLPCIPLGHRRGNYDTCINGNVYVSMDTNFMRLF
ncbi:unnamed protein product [Soboliphyme baturini]|uniref:PINc domain-containing protein n=1 Tax=Soboliphyme baturini TaxID=241478 RepID=A0A183I963_9BILA|nr:unnamed protein product [Soboliphyme baturini]